MPKSSCQKNLAQEQFSELFLMQFCNFCLSSAQNLLKAEQFRVEIDSWTARGKFFFLFVAVRLSVVKNIAQFVFLLTIWLLNYENFWVNRNLTTRNIELVLSQSYRLEIREWWFETIANRVLRSILIFFHAIHVFRHQNQLMKHNTLYWIKYWGLESRRKQMIVRY